MLAILSNRTYRHLFAAQVIALIGTGLATVALGLLAWNLAGDDAGLVLGTALALAAFGGGSMIAALFLPRVLDRFEDRPPMLIGAALLMIGTPLGYLVTTLPLLLGLWLVLGFGYSLTQTPSGRLLRKSAQAEDRPAIFAAQFALSHTCWLITYPLAGRFGAGFGLDVTFLLMGATAAFGFISAMILWPANDPQVMEHDHSDLPPDHPHLRDHGKIHSHPLIIDDLHRHWPRGA